MDTIQAENPAVIDPGAAATGADLYKAGLAYSTGQCAELCYVQAHKWFNLAALAGVAEAKIYRRELSELMSSGEIAQAQQAAREWLMKAAALGPQDSLANTANTATPAEVPSVRYAA